MSGQVFPQLMVNVSVRYNVFSLLFNWKQTFGRDLCRDIYADGGHFSSCEKDARKMVLLGGRRDGRIVFESRYRRRKDVDRERCV